MKVNKIHGFFILMVFWVLFSMKTDLASLVLGAAASLTVILVSWEFVSEKKTIYLPAPKIFLKYIYFLLIDIYKDSFVHIKRIIKNKSMPNIVEINLPTKDPIILTMLSNYITLTPGTITVDVEENIIYVLDIEGEEGGEKTKKSVLDIYNKVFK